MQRARTLGVSLPGMLSAIIVLAIIAYFIALYSMKNTEQQNIKKIKQDISVMMDALEQYKLDNGNYPTTNQGLDALVNQPTSGPSAQYWNPKGYISALPVDPWNQPYQYTNTDGIIRIYSIGPGGKEGASEIDLTNVDQQ